MNDNKSTATKQDIQIITKALKKTDSTIQLILTEMQADRKENKQNSQMILDMMNLFREDVDKRFEQMNKRFGKIDERFEESELHTRILIEDLRSDILGANTDQLSVHSDKLENHEVRIGNLEEVGVCA